MTNAKFEITADALHAYVDGQLGDAERAEVERYLAAHPDAAAEIAGWQRQNDAIHALFPAPVGEPVPEALNPRNIADGVRTARAQSWRNIAAAAILLVIGGAVGWAGHDYSIPAEAASDRLIDEAVAAHTLYVKEQTHAVEAAANSPNLMRWLSNRITTPIDAPDLTAQGFTFIGARLLPGDYDGKDPSPAAELMYQNASAERVTLYITAALPDKKEVWQFESHDGLEAYYWSNAFVTCTIVSDLSETDVRLLGKNIFEQLTRHADSSWNPKG